MNTRLANFPFLPKAVLLFIFPPLKPLTSKHLNQIYVNKRNLCMAQKSHIRFRFFYWSLLLPITMESISFSLFRQLCLYISDLLPLLSLFLTDSFKKCLTKSFDNINSLLSASFAVGRPRFHFSKRVIPKNIRKWYSQHSCLALSTKRIEWKTSRQACLLCPWAGHLTKCLHLHVAGPSSC